MRLNLKAAAALAALALIVLTSGAAGAEPTAAQVRDDESLKAYVEAAKAHLEAITELSEISKFREQKLRPEGDWKSGSTFIIIFFESGEPIFHANDRAAENKSLLGVEDDRGTRVVEELLKAAAQGGGFVEYHDGEPKTAYAVEYISGFTETRFVVVGGYSQDVSHVPGRIAVLPKPAVTASQVVDRETLIAFVEEAAKLYRTAMMSDSYIGLPELENAFRLEGGDWRSGSIYLWVVSGEGITLFHATEPYREGKAHGHDEDGLQGDKDRRGVGRRRAARGPEVPSLPLRQPGHRGRRGDRFAQARLRGERPAAQHGAEGRYWLRHLCRQGRQMTLGFACRSDPRYSPNGFRQRTSCRPATSHSGSRRQTSYARTSGSKLAACRTRGGAWRLAEQRFSEGSELEAHADARESLRPAEAVPHRRYAQTQGGIGIIGEAPGLGQVHRLRNHPQGVRLAEPIIDARMNTQVFHLKVSPCASSPPHGEPSGNRLDQPLQAP